MKKQNPQDRMSYSQAAPLVFVFLFFAVLPSSCARQPAYPAPPLKGSEVVIDVNSLRPEMPVFYTYRYHGKRINFFVMKIQDRVSSFLDACASCYPHRLGYRFENGILVCRACSVEYSVTKIEKGIGSCYPIRIAGNVRGGEYRIPVSALESAVDKF